MYTKPFLKYSKDKPIFYVHFPLRALSRYARYYGEFSFGIYLYDKILSLLATILEDYKYLDKIRVYANSSFTAKEFEKIYCIKPEVMNPTISIHEDFKYFGEKKENIIVTIGRITPQKGQLRLIIAIKNMKNLLKKSGWKVLIIGRYNRDIFGIKKRYLNKLKKYIRKFSLGDIVEIKLNVSLKELTTILKKSKIYVHTMIGEHFGISAYETKEAGCILVLPEKSGAWEDIEYDKKYCFGDIEDLTKVLLELLRKVY